MTRARPRSRGLLWAALAALVGALLVAAASAPAGAQIVPKPPLATPSAPAIDGPQAVRIASANPELRDWIAQHPVARTTPELDSGDDEGWVVFYVARGESPADETVEAQVIVDPQSGEIREVRTGPQVAWSMARGYEGAFGRAINRPAVWLTLCALFLLPLLAWRRILSWRTLDLLVLLSFGVSLVWFNRGEIFTSVPLAYPPLVYLAARLAWIGLRRPRSRPDLEAAEAAVAPAEPRRPGLAGACPTWLLVSLLAVALLLRYGLNAFDSNVIDVGYAGVIGADLVLEGQAPYGNFPEDCGSCDTYGPLNYLAYTPFVAALGWSGDWDDLPAAHGAATAFDLLCVLGMLVLGWQLGGVRLGVALGLAWAAFPFTGYTLASNANDALLAAALIWGIVAARRPLARGLLLGLAVATKFAPAVLVVLWARHPFPFRRAGGRRATARALAAHAGGLVLAGALTGWVLLLDGAGGISAFWSRTIGFQAGRDSPFSIWGQNPGLRSVQIGVMALVALAALAMARWPRRLDLRSWAALGGALTIGVQLTLTHWFYLYIPWFLPFALLALVPDWPAPTRAPAAAAPTPAPVATAAPAPALAGAAARAGVGGDLR